VPKVSCRINIPNPKILETPEYIKIITKNIKIRIYACQCIRNRRQFLVASEIKV
jgi:hypothetical protein